MVDIMSEILHLILTQTHQIQSETLETVTSCSFCYQCFFLALHVLIIMTINITFSLLVFSYSLLMRYSRFMSRWHVLTILKSDWTLIKHNLIINSWFSALSKVGRFVDFLIPFRFRILLPTFQLPADSIMVAFHKKSESCHSNVNKQQKLNENYQKYGN